MQFAFGYAAPLMIEAAVRIGVFDVLGQGPRTVEEVSTATGASMRGLRALMNALVGLDLLLKDDAQRYLLAAESAAFLVQGSPAFLGDFFCLASGHLIPRWLRLTQCVRTGRPEEAVNEEKAGVPFFQELTTAILPLGMPAADALAEAMAPTATAQTFRVLDLAAGAGVWGIALARRLPCARVTALDWAGVMPVTRRTVDRFGLASRFEFVEADLMEATYGNGYQLAVFGHILHSEGEERSRSLLRKAYDALDPGGRVAIAEWLVDEGRRGPPHCLIFAVSMLVATTHGDTFSFDEIAAWLRDAGFEDVHALEVQGPSPLILARRPQ
jgi:SAM-dependent methyltransferase